MAFVHTNPVSYYSKTSQTRPNNATAYVAATNNVVCGIWTFKNVGPANDRETRVDGAVVTLTDTRFEIDVSSVPAGMTSFRLHLYSASPASALTDGAAWDLPAGDRVSYLGYVDLGSPSDVGSTLWVQQSQVNTPFKLASGVSSLYGYLVTNAGYTPTAQAVYSLALYTLAA